MHTIAIIHYRPPVADLMLVGMNVVVVVVSASIELVVEGKAARKKNIS